MAKMTPNLLHNILLAVLIFSLPVISRTPAASTLHLSHSNTSFSLNIPTNSTNLYFRLEAPAVSWVGVGIGREMKGGLMFVVYASEDGHDVTLSPRIATGTNEPAYASDIRVELLAGSGIRDGRFVVNAVCFDCHVWRGGSLDVESTEQPWMYAFRARGKAMASDDLAAGLTQHGFYGRFNMDMLQATGIGGVPSSGTQLSGVELVGTQFVASADKVSTAHGYIMAAVVLICAPVLMLHLLSKARLVWVSCASFVTVLLLGYAMGIWDSFNYNRSKDFRSTHQVLGFVVSIQLLLVALSQLMPKRMVRNDVKSFGVTTAEVYGVTVFVIWILALTNGFLGMKLADARKKFYVAYGCATIAMIVIFAPLCVAVLKIFRRNRDRDAFKENAIRMS